MAGLPPVVFETFAGAYDLLTRQGYWDRQIGVLIDQLGPLRPGARLLDLGCGTGASTLEAARRLPDAAEVTGVDLSRAMIARARTHLARHPDLSRVRLVEADATALPFEDEAFDAAIAHSFLYLVPDRAAVLRELFRVVAPGAAVAFMEPNSAASLPRAARAAAAHAGELVRHPWAAGRFSASMVSWRLWGAFADKPTPAELEDLFAGAGFADLRLRPTLGGLGLHCHARRATGEDSAGRGGWGESSVPNDPG